MVCAAAFYCAKKDGLGGRAGVRCLQLACEVAVCSDLLELPVAGASGVPHWRDEERLVVHFDLEDAWPDGGWLRRPVWPLDLCGNGRCKPVCKCRHGDARSFRRRVPHDVQLREVGVSPVSS